ncbi:glycine betaine transporter [Clostridium tetanomorphum]|uniref:BCCT family transporter n=1 Tax=Clostridium tetanomorphum TaxID=1553 RepID=A0A923EBT6_CLOTT|nr:BCCT family transporter [Clostridium tetanomorphum]KAJ53557.1 choline/carnitine/betaine transporter [Clostridium tetanomorphum DSM 665]MBC2398069.1 BCCT family transporter [Clostridium tetanomorphum]MBP1864636.1 glycine betaine transporter [Clostridium tetanomorphum]NRS84106.1 glycine betaine transporter [Clostridium tetanomorphum]NRZ97319.1 glycine betaine transporter [Clostridium tetanomorphum]
MIEKIKKDKVFYISSITLTAVMIFAFFNIEIFSKIAKSTLDLLLNKFYWLYSGAMLSFFIFCIWVAFSKYGKIRLGDDNEKPEYSFISWLSMLFCAGMGMGLVFWSIAEPLTHYVYPDKISGFTEEAKMFALKKVFLHWGTSAWGCYAILALILAYMQFRKKKPALMSSALIPIIGEERAKGTLGNIVDIFTIFATVAGIITSLGLGTLQINAGLNYLFNIPENIKIKLLIIGIVTICYMTSAISGIDKGIQTLSNINIFIAAFMIIFVSIIGPTPEIFKNLFRALGIYGKEVLTTNNNIFLHGGWYKDWTLFYWGWWIAWAPPVGIFIARISRGRTIKEFVLGVLMIPSLLCFIWFAIFGTVGFNVDKATILTAIQKADTAFFIVMSKYPYSLLINILVMILSSIFFITSADSSTFVLAMLSSKGNLNPKNSRKIVWGILQGALTIAFLLAGGLEMIQTASILAAFPFAFIMLFSMISFRKSLREEDEILELKSKEKVVNAKYKLG